jgi:hypothetical protein
MLSNLGASISKTVPDGGLFSFHTKKNQQELLKIPFHIE